MKRRLIKDFLSLAEDKKTPDLIIKNGRILNVFTDSILDGFSIAIKDGFIVLIERDLDLKGKEIIDAEGLYLCPGFIDAHTHLDSLFSFHEFVPYAIKGGTTTVVSECAMVGCALGIKGVEAFIRSTKGYPLRTFFVAPALTPPFPFAEGCKGLKISDFKKLLKREDFLGIGEAYWNAVLEKDEAILKRFEFCLSLGKRIDGHASGAKGRKLTVYSLTGITSCHESITLEEAKEKIEMGLYVMIREGFVRKELEELSKLKDEKVDKKRLILVSDTFDALMLLDGYMDRVVRSAIEWGFDPKEAIKMVTINPAEYHGLRYLGAIAPLRKADILFISDLEKVKIEKVIFDGKLVFSEGRFIPSLRPFSFPLSMKKTILTDPFEEKDFEIRFPKGAKGIRIIEIVNETITKEVKREGFDFSSDLCLVSVINRGPGKKYSLGFLKGTGIKEGALSTSMSWDTGNIVAIGKTPEDLKVAVNRLIEIGGGYTVSKNGKILFEFPMPIFGLASSEKMEKIGEKEKEFEQKARETGCTLSRPFLTLQVIPFTGLPFLRITDKGLFDVKEKRLLSPFLF